MTPQDIFNRVWNTLKERGWTRAGVQTDDGFKCQYRSPVGPCAIGIFLAEEEYIPEMDENGGWTTDRAVERCAALRGVELPGQWFLADLQFAHDQGASPDKMRATLEYFARQYNLEIPA